MTRKSGVTGRERRGLAKLPLPKEARPRAAGMEMGATEFRRSRSFGQLAEDGKACGALRMRVLRGR